MGGCSNRCIDCTKMFYKDRYKEREHAAQVKESKKLYEKYKVPFIEGERWADIEGYGGAYKISDHGRVLSYKLKYGGKRLLSVHKSKYHGYWQTCLAKDKKPIPAIIHSLVAHHFLPPPPDDGFKYEVGHADENKDNYHYSNLYWTTRPNNMRHRFEHKKRQTYKGDVSMINPETNELVAKFKSVRAATRTLNLNLKWTNLYVNRVLNKDETVFGYKWKRELAP